MQKFLGCLRGRIRANDLNTTAIIFSAFNRSLMIYYFTQLVAAGGITEKEIENIEAQMKKSQYGLKGDVPSATVQKVLSYHDTSTAKLLSKIGGRLRASIAIALRARPKKGLIETKPIEVANIKRDEEKAERAQKNQRSFKLELSSLRLIIALGLFRTTDTYVNVAFL